MERSTEKKRFRVEEGWQLQSYDVQPVSNLISVSFFPSLIFVHVEQSVQVHEFC